MTDMYEATLQEDSNGDLFFTFPLELLNQMGWTEETLVEWDITDNAVVVREFKEEDAGTS